MDQQCYDFSYRASDTAPPPTGRQRKKVYCALNEPCAFQTGSAYVISKSGHVQLSLRSAASRWASSLGECSDWRCGCSRMRRPEVRRSFKDLVAAKGAESIGAEHGVHYVSVGSGLLLIDFEILCALEERGLRIERITVIDTAYRYALGVVGDARIDSLDGNAYDRCGFEAFYKPRCGAQWEQVWESALTPERVAEAIQQLARFFPSAEVRVFPSIERFRASCSESPEVYGGNNCFVHCDAGGVDRESSRAAASACLTDGALAFYLENMGGHERLESMGAEPWPSKSKFDPLSDVEVAYLHSLLEVRSVAECWQCLVSAGGERTLVDQVDERCACFDPAVVDERRKVVARLLRRQREGQMGAKPPSSSAPAAAASAAAVALAAPAAAAPAAVAAAAAAADRSHATEPPPPTVTPLGDLPNLVAPLGGELTMTCGLLPTVWLGSKRNAARAGWRVRARGPRCLDACGVCAT